MTMTNKTGKALEIEVDRGLVFEASPEDRQSFVITRPEIIALGPGQTISTAVFAMCIESFDGCPDGRTSFSYQGKADDQAQKVLAYIDDNDLQNPLGQEAIWTTFNREPIDWIWSNDSIRANNIRAFMEENTDLPVTEADYDPSYAQNQIISRTIKIGGSVEYYSSKSGDEVYIALFNDQGVLERELYYNPNFPSGKVKAAYEFNAGEFTASSYLIRLTVDGAIKYEREIDLSHLPDRE